jgi:predicted DNA-binding transcriptional regulator YafY
MRADRLLSILLFLQTRERITALELSQKLEVSERTIYRDLDALSAAGIPVFAERGPGGGLALTEEYRTNLTGLTESEVKSLFLAFAPSSLADLGMEKHMEGALLKLLAGLPSAQRRNAELARRRIYLDAASWNRPEEYVPYIGAIQKALWEERRLKISYSRSDYETVERLVEPYGLVAKATVWYLVAAAEGEERVFRVSRIKELEILDEHFNFPENFDLPAYWQQWVRSFTDGRARYPVKFRVSPRGIPVLPIMFGEGIRQVVDRAAPPDEEGWITLEMIFENLPDARGRLLGFGSKVEVLEPLELREAMLAFVEEVAAFYRERMAGATQSR